MPLYDPYTLYNHNWYCFNSISSLGFSSFPSYSYFCSFISFFLSNYSISIVLVLVLTPITLLSIPPFMFMFIFIFIFTLIASLLSFSLGFYDPCILFIMSLKSILNRSSSLFSYTLDYFLSNWILLIGLLCLISFSLYYLISFYCFSYISCRNLSMLSNSQLAFPISYCLC